MANNFQLGQEYHTSLQYSLSKMSKGVKFCHYLLTSPELGYTKVEVEYFLEKNKATDIYIHDVDLCIEIDGPPHYFSNTGERKLGL